MTEKNIKKTYEYRICILKDSRRIITNGFRNNQEYFTKTTNALADRSQGGEPRRNQKEKLDGSMIRTTAVSLAVRKIPFGIDLRPTSFNKVF